MKESYPSIVVVIYVERLHKIRENTDHIRYLDCNNFVCEV